MWKGILGCALLTTAPTVRAVAAQEVQPRTRDGAYAAAVALLQRGARGADSIRVAPDSITMYRLFVRCEGPKPAPSTCALIDGKPVTMVLVELADSVTAMVQARFYVMGLGCPGPQRRRGVRGIVSTGMDEYTLTYVDGHWQPPEIIKTSVC